MISPYIIQTTISSTFDKLKEDENKNLFEIIVVATMSAGKSTVINALIGQELLHSANEATTATITRIHDKDELPFFSGCAYGYQSELLKESNRIDAQTLKEWNADPSIKTIDLMGDIAAIKNDNAELVIYDTPGPNNSQNNSHKALTEEILEDGNYGLVIFVLNSSNLGTNDENDLLHLVQNALKNSPNKKVVFLLNKKEVLENLEETIIRVKENLTNIGFKEPLIFPISAYSALLLHKKINHQELDEDEMIDLELLIKKGKRAFKEQYLTETEFNALLLENTGINAFYHYLQQLISSNHRLGQRMQQEVKFTHNPFKNETSFSLNGETITHGKYKTFATQRLQMWISQFFQTVENTLQTKEFFVDFTGVPSDCADVEEAIQQANAAGFNISYQFSQIRSQNERIAELEELVNEIRENPILNQIMSESQWNGVMDKYFDAWVVGTMSSGKSTFINALLGHEALPAFQEDTTASITKIIDNKKFSQGEFSACRFNKEGEYLNKDLALNLLTPEQADKSREILAEWNADIKNQEKPENERTYLIELKGNIIGIQQRDDVQLRITDTPGSNTDKSNVSQHALTSRKMLRDDQRNPLVLYVLRGDNLRVNDDNAFLSDMSNIMKEKGKLAQDRFMFLVNKMDVFFGKGESIEETLKGVIDYLASFGIENPNVFPICSRFALALKNQQLSAELLDADDEDEIIALGSKISREGRDLNQYMRLSENVKNRLTEKQLSPAFYRTGIPAVELVIDEYISKYHIIYRIQRIQEVIADLLRRAHNSDAYKVALENIKDQEEQLKKAIEYLKDSEEKGNSTQNYIDSLNTREIAIPEHITDAFNSELLALERKFEEWDNKFRNKKSDKEEANRKLTKINNEIKALCETIVLNLNSGVELAQNEMIKNLSNEYKEYISKFFKDIPNLDIDVIKGFENHLKDFDIQLVIKPEYEKEESKKVYRETSGFWGSVARWFGFGGYESFTIKETIIDLEELWKEQKIELYIQINQIIPAVVDSVREYAQEITETYIKQLDQIFKPELARLTQELLDLAQDNEKREAEIKRAKSNIDAIKKYQARLNAIIEA